MAPPTPPGLMDDLIGEILLHLPPEDPQYIIRASVVCKSWRRLLSDPGFLRRYREFHRSPPLLGFLHTECRWLTNGRGQSFIPRFVPIKKASPIVNPRPEPDSNIIDCRHGRVLLFKPKSGFIIWDPITNIRQNIGQNESMDHRPYRFTAAVLCTAIGCDHLGCHGGPSIVVSAQINIATQHDRRRATVSASASVYSTETGTWNAGVSSVQFDHLMFGYRKAIGSSLLTGDVLYFVLEDGGRILKYDLSECGLSLMSSPPLPVGNMVLLKAEDGGLGACGVEGHSLHLWAWRTGPGGVLEWQRSRVIQLDNGDLARELEVVDFAEGAGSIFVRANKGVFAVEINSGRARKIGKGGGFNEIFPFMSFYTPDHATTRLQAPMMME